MDEETQKRKRFLIDVAYYVVILALYFIFFRYVLYQIMPFVIALAVTLLLRGPVDWCSKKLHIPRRGVAAVFVLLTYGLLAFLVVFGLIELVLAVSAWFSKLPVLYTTQLAPTVRQIMDYIEELVAKLSPQILLYIEQMSDQILSAVYNLVSSLSSSILSFAQSLVTGIPSTVIGIVFCVIATVFFEMDYPQIYHFVMAQFSEKNQEVLRGVKRFFRNTVGKMIVAYTILMGITFVELDIGLHLIGIDNANVVALIIAITDILPALGTGTVLSPWAVIVLIQGKVAMCIKLVCLYLVITLIRNFIEPKLVGTSTGVQPALLLLCMYLGAKILGPLGFLVLPVTVIVIKQLNDAGLIHLFNSDYRDDSADRKRRGRSKKRGADGGKESEEKTGEIEKIEGSEAAAEAASEEESEGARSADAEDVRSADAEDASPARGETEKESGGR